MIIFDLDGTLADYEHRRHFVDSKKAFDTGDYFWDGYEENCPIYLRHKQTKEKFEPDYKSFYEACDKDGPIIPVFHALSAINRENICPIRKILFTQIQIWSGRCESVRGKTINWLNKQGLMEGKEFQVLKMRPIGDFTPDDQLKEKWLDDHIAGGGKPIDFVFDDRPKVVSMWRRRGIFVFDCNQTGKEF